VARLGPGSPVSSIGNVHDPGNPFYLGMHRSQSRRWADVRRRCDQWVQPYLSGGWEPDDLEQCLDTFADERPSAADWRRFGQLYVETLEPEEIRRLIRLPLTTSRRAHGIGWARWS
jgi:hypothetical protein